jgi:hypothetical protein
LPKVRFVGLWITALIFFLIAFVIFYFFGKDTWYRMFASIASFAGIYALYTRSRFIRDKDLGKYEGNDHRSTTDTRSYFEKNIWTFFIVAAVMVIVFLVLSR